MEEERARQTLLGLCLESDRFDDSFMADRLQSELNTLKTQELCRYYLALRMKGETVDTDSHLIAYLIGLSDVYNENSNRPYMGDMPDIDIDFSAREPVVNYLKEKYGDDKVAYVNNYVELSGKSAINDICRVMEIPVPKKIKDEVEKMKFATKYLKSKGHTLSPEHRKVIEYAAKLEENVRHYSVSAAGVVVSKLPVSDYSGMWYKDEKLISVYDKKDVEKIGFIKMDILRVVAVEIIQKCLDLVVERGGTIPQNIWDLPLDDPLMMEEFKKANTDLIFQYQGFATKDLLGRMKPDNITDLIAVASLSRPGPDEKEYMENMKDREGIKYAHPILEKLLSERYNTILYQEDFMRVCREFALMSARDTNRVRKMVGKKDTKEAPELKRIFVRGAKRNGIDETLANAVWGLILRHGDYGFNICLSPDTKIRLADGKTKTIQSLNSQFRENPNEPIYLMSMFEDGTIKPHKMKRIWNTGKQEKVCVKTKGKRSITMSPEHRTLTTRGYIKAKDLYVGDEFVTVPKHIEEDDKRHITSKNNIKIAMQSEKQIALQRDGGNIKKYQGTIGFDERSKHQQKIQKKNPHRMDNAIASSRAKMEILRKDPDWIRSHKEATIKGLESKGIDPHRVYWGWGNRCYASDGTYCYSIAERNMCEFLIEREISFESQKVLANGRPCDFYFEGIYWEMDGMNRDESYWEDKYGDLPYVVVNPDNFRDKIDKHLSMLHVQNGDPIVSIEYKGQSSNSFYDIEMEDNGPKNFLLKNGIVSHNCHATAYFIVGWAQMYLQVYHPFEWILANLIVAENENTKNATIKMAMKMGIEFSTADVNRSKLDWSYDGNILVPGLNYIPGVGPKAAEAIVESAPYTSEKDMDERLPRRLFNRRVRDVLKEAGAIPGIEGNVIKSSVAAGLPVDVTKNKEIHKNWRPVGYSQANGCCVVQAYVKKSRKEGGKYAVYFQSDIPGLGYANDKIEEGSYLLIMDAKWDSIFGAIPEEKFDRHPSDAPIFQKNRQLLSTDGPGYAYVVDSRKINRAYPTMILCPQPRIVWMGEQHENGKFGKFQKDRRSNLWAKVK